MQLRKCIVSVFQVVRSVKPRDTLGRARVSGICFLLEFLEGGKATCCIGRTWKVIPPAWKNMRIVWIACEVLAMLDVPWRNGEAGG